ncbi:MAG: hypothetical protein HYS21_05435 [Deltaproteobacteria bacterium]|nr:hypothetical protein [Deltaproteobacteria bacterium]
MAILILDIGSETVRAGLFSQKLEPAGFFTAPIHAGRNGSISVKEEVKGALESLFTSIKSMGKAFESFEKVLVSIPPSDMSIRIVTVPFEDRRKIGEVLPFELAGLLHMDIEEMEVDSIPLGENKVLAIAIEKKIIREYLEILNESGIDPAWVGSSLFSLPVLLKELYPLPGIKAFIARDSLSVSEDGNPKFFKPIKRIDGIRLGLAYLDAENIRINEAYATGWDLDDLRVLMPDVKIEELMLPAGYPSDGAGIYALSLVLRNGTLGETINFRKGEFEYTKEKAHLRRYARITAIVLGIILLMIIGDLYIRYLGMKKEFNAYNDTLKTSYQQLFPNEKNTGDEVYQLEAKLKALDKEADVVGGGVSALKIMNGIANASADGHRFKIFELSISGGRVKARGEADSFEGANKLKEALSKDPLFKEASVSDIKAKPGGGTSFSLNLTLNKAAYGL